MSQILVVDDEIGIRELLSEILADEGHTVQLAENAARARALRAAERPDLVLLDIWMPDTDGITLLKEWAANGQLTMPVVMMSGHGTIETAVEATRIGAIDFLEKPIALQKLLATVKRALRRAGGQPQAGLTLLSLGRSPVLAELRKRLAQVATHVDAGAAARRAGRHAGAVRALPAPAEYALGRGGRSTGRCAAGLAGAGRQRPAFRRGIGSAHPGAAEESGFHPGQSRIRPGRASSPSPPRIRRASPASSVSTRRLLARLSELSLPLPALREHAEDIPDIAGILLAQLVEARNCPPRHFSTAALNALRQFHWPRNLQDLQGAVKNLALTALEEEIGAADVERVAAQFHPAADTQVPLPLALPLREAREAFERAYFEQLLAREAGSIARVAEKSGLERTHLYRKLKALGIATGKKEE